MVRGFVSWYFSLRRFNHLAKGLEMRQGVWARVPVGLVSIVTQRCGRSGRSATEEMSQ